MAASGVPIADLETRVTPLPHLVFFWNAFFHLSGDRQIGMGLGPIPFMAIDRYASRYGADDLQLFELLQRFLRAMDAVFLEVHAAKIKKG